MRATITHTVLAFGLSLLAGSPARAQTIAAPDAPEGDRVAPVSSSPPRLLEAETLFAPQGPAGPPPTPRHTGVKALARHLVTNYRYLPSQENLYWAGGGGALALGAHRFDDDVNRRVVASTSARRFFRPGQTIGQMPTLLAAGTTIYAFGRIRDEPKVSHLGMDLLEALAMSESVTQAVKFATRRERPDGSSRNSFPSGHAADTFAFATALERHLNWRFSVPAYAFASYVAISRLPANRHWLSDAVFGSAVGIVAGRTVTSHEAERPYPVAVTPVPGGVAIMYARHR
jgi:hypothetical protein